MANLAAVVGIGQTKYTTKRTDVSIAGLVREAAVNALQDADLTWDDIDEARGKIVVWQGVRRGTVDTPKTHASRELGMTADMAQLLRAHREWLMQSRHPGLATGLVFPSDVGTHRGPESLHKPLAKAGDSAGVGVRVGPQVLRRTFNTLQVQAGVDRIVLRSQMGHCSEEMTERYAGVPVEAKREAVAALEVAVKSAMARDAKPGRKPE